VLSIGRPGPQAVSQEELLWALGSICALHRLPFAAELLQREFPPPCTHGTLIAAGRALALKMKQVRLKPAQIERMVLPLLVSLRRADAVDSAQPSLGLVTAATDGKVVLFAAGTNEALTLDHAEFSAICAGDAWLVRPETEALSDPDTLAGTSSKFGFRWFVPELLKHKHVWRDVLLASLALQLVALATPLFTQAIIDKVVVHRTQSTLIAIGIAMVIFTVFTSLLTWVRQYLVLHTGNRVDAVLGAAVWDHLLKLPVRYFQYRPTGVVAARLHGVENIREFVASAAVTLVLDMPFLLICLGVMLWYSVMLTAIAIGILLVIGIASFLVAPIFQRRLNEQFLLSARNQAFVTEHIGGFETVKSLQMEPQLRQRYASYLATYLQSGFQTKQIGNTYNVVASTMDQLQTLAILMVGAYTVMTEPSFTIGMLVAFQMFAGKLSQPVMRIVGLWTQFQQAKLSVERLGDVMNAPCEPYSLTPKRSGQGDGSGRIEVRGLAFRYADDRPLLYQDLDLVIEPGKAVALMGPSGSGKSTLAKLMLGFYQPTAGSISIGGVDIRHMAANELRALRRGAAGDGAFLRNDLRQPHRRQPRRDVRTGRASLQDVGRARRDRGAVAGVPNRSRGAGCRFVGRPEAAARHRARVTQRPQGLDLRRSHVSTRCGDGRELSPHRQWPEGQGDDAVHCACIAKSVPDQQDGSAARTVRSGQGRA